MLLWLLTSIAINHSALAATPEPRPSSAPAAQNSATLEEANLLWSEVQRLFQGGHELEAIPYLRRLIARHPGSANYLEAHRLLGIAYLQSESPTEALEPIRYFVDGSRTLSGELDSRLLLGRAYLQLKRYPELLLLAAETETRARKAKSPQLLPLAEALLLKGKALHHLKRAGEARLVLDSAERTLSGISSAPASIKADLALTNLEFKLADCRSLPSSRKLAEEKVRNQMQRRASCLLESLTLHKRVNEIKEEQFAKQADKAVTQAWVDYLKSATHPPLPPPLKPTDRTGRELKRYLEELSQALVQDARKKLSEANSLLEGKTAQSELKKALQNLASSEGSWQ